MVIVFFFTAILNLEQSKVTRFIFVQFADNLHVQSHRCQKLQLSCEIYAAVHAILLYCRLYYVVPLLILKQLPCINIIMVQCSKFPDHANLSTSKTLFCWSKISLIFRGQPCNHFMTLCSVFQSFVVITICLVAVQSWDDDVGSCQAQDGKLVHAYITVQYNTIQMTPYLWTKLLIS